MKIISCRIFKTYISGFLNKNDEVVYLDIQMHNYPKKLTKLIQKEIDNSNHHRILVLYGLCGNALLEIHSGNKEVFVIKAHDCLSILLGGYQNYLHYFESRKSSSWTCRGLLINDGDFQLKEYQQWLNDYGKEEADYLKSVLCQPCHIYIQMEDDDINTAYSEIILGDRQYLKDIIHLLHDDLLILSKNHQLKLTNDENVIEII